MLSKTQGDARGMLGAIVSRLGGFTAPTLTNAIIRCATADEEAGERDGTLLVDGRSVMRCDLRCSHLTHPLAPATWSVCLFQAVSCRDGPVWSAGPSAGRGADPPGAVATAADVGPALQPGQCAQPAALPALSLFRLHLQLLRVLAPGGAGVEGGDDHHLLHHAPLRHRRAGHGCRARRPLHARLGAAAQLHAAGPGHDDRRPVAPHLQLVVVVVPAVRVVHARLLRCGGGEARALRAGRRGYDAGRWGAS